MPVATVVKPTEINGSTMPLSTSIILPTSSPSPLDLLKYHLRCSLWLCSVHGHLKGGWKAFSVRFDVDRPFLTPIVFACTWQWEQREHLAEEVGLGSGRSSETTSNYTSCCWASTLRTRKENHHDWFTDNPWWMLAVTWHFAQSRQKQWTCDFATFSYWQVIFSLAGPGINPAGSANQILVT